MYLYIYMHACILKKFRRKLLFYFWVTTCIMYLCMCIYISACNFLMDLFIVDISRWFKNTWCKRRTSCDTMVVKHSKATINHPYFDGLSVYPTISHLFVVQLKMVCYCFTNIELNRLNQNAFFLLLLTVDWSQ
jgi:hypothetical protein